jgi:glutamyl-tRNA synthetase
VVSENEGIEEIAVRSALLNAVKHGGKADINAVMSKVMGELKDKRLDPRVVYSAVKSAVEKVNMMHYEMQLEEAKKYFTEEEKNKAEERNLPELPFAEKGKVVLRLPPEPSGYMHIGHAMAFSINYIYKKMYDGKLWLRFEDTNPRKVDLRYYESFRDGIKWLGIEYDYEKYVSADLEKIYHYGRIMIERGRAYACSCEKERVKKMRFEGTECEHRQNSVEKNLRIWDEMLGRKYREGEYVIRFKGDTKSQDYSLRDPNIFRIIEKEHPITGKKFVVWPTYDIANVVEDEICGVTHVLRSSEFHTLLQEMMRSVLSFRKIQVTQFSRFNFKGTPVQKRLLRPLVEKGYVSGWDDPRMPTVEGIRRRGIIPEAVIRFTQDVGYTKSEHEYDWSLLFAVNRKLLDPVAKRLFFVPDPVPLTVKGLKREVNLRLHPDKELGTRKISVNEKLYISSDDFHSMQVGEVFRLMELCNLRLVLKDDSAEAEYVGDDLIQGIKKIQWVTDNSVKIKVIIPSELFDESGNFREDSLKEKNGLAEEYFSNLKVGEIIRFVRFGFCRVDDREKVIFTHK